MYESFRLDYGKYHAGGWEGHRIFSAFQPREYMHRLFFGMVVRKHDEPQDIWIVGQP